MAITRESAREMSDEALTYTLNDLNEVIEICEATFRADANEALLEAGHPLGPPGFTPAGYDRPLTAKHSQYLDERFAIIEAMVARRPTRVRDACMNCGAPATMNASLGPACPDCYDALSD